MSGALFRKEMRSLRPFMAIVLALLLIDLVDAFLDPLGANGFAQRLSSLSIELGIVQLMLALMLGTGLLVREIDDGTLQFLDGLPLGRWTVFATKFRAAMLVLLIYPTGTLLLSAALHAGVLTSLDHAMRPLLLLTMLGLCVLATAVALTAGMLLGFVRHMAWLVLSLFLIGVKLLQDKAPSTAAALDTTDLLTARFTGTAWQLPMATIWTQLGAALLFGGMAFALFNSAGNVRAQAQRIGRSRRWLARIGIALMLAAGLGGLALLIERRAHDESPGKAVAGNRADALEFTPIAGAHAKTGHYTFSYPALSSTRMRPLIEAADRTFKDVAAMLGIDGGAPIDVDLSGTTENHAGTAYLDRIRMRVDDGDAIPTLAHETTHVFAGRLAHSDRMDQLAGMMVLNEGLAHWVENRIGAPSGVSETDALAAAIVSARRLVAPRRLTEQGAFAATVDDNLKYPLGAILIDSLVTRYGAAAPKTLLITLGREDFPRDLQGYALWQTAFQLAGFDLDLVLDDYARRLKQLESAYAQRIASLPRPRGSLVEHRDDYAVVLRFDRPVQSDIVPVVRFRPGTIGDSSSYRTQFAGSPSAGTYEARVPDHMITRGEVCFQPGVMVESVVMYERWTCLQVSAASAD
jgi:ABC-type transport system involved in multi-copper enzyme maturation permease subunit